MQSAKLGAQEGCATLYHMVHSVTVDECMEFKPARRFSML